MSLSLSLCFLYTAAHTHSPTPAGDRAREAQLGGFRVPADDGRSNTNTSAPATTHAGVATALTHLYQRVPAQRIPVLIRFGHSQTSQLPYRGPSIESTRVRFARNQTEPGHPVSNNVCVCVCVPFFLETFFACFSRCVFFAACSIPLRSSSSRSNVLFL